MISDPLAFHGLPVLVTGASSGVGRETAILLSELGARVVLAGRDPKGLEDTRARLRGDGHAIGHFDPAGDLDSIPAWVQDIADRVGPLHGLVHCADIFEYLTIGMSTFARLDAMLRLNLASAIMLVKGFCQNGCASAGGGVVLLSSAVGGLAGQPDTSLWAASKAAVIGFTRSAALELAPRKLRVNCIAHGVVESEMAAKLGDRITPDRFQAIGRQHPLGIGTPRDVASGVAFLLGETGRWITGTALILDGGLTASHRV